MALGCIAVAVSAPASAVAGTWASQESHDFHDLRAVAFVDPTHGWASGSLAYNAKIHATTDGGVTWFDQDAFAAHQAGGGVLDMSFVDRTHGWAGEDLGVVVATANGGATWTKKTSPGLGMVNTISFVDRTHGWAAGWNGGHGDGLFVTADGGNSWTPQEPTGPNELKILNGSSFVDLTHGWMVGDEGRIIGTSNGGTDWIAETSGTSENLLSVSFVDRKHGWAVGTGGTILATTDGGIGWGAQSSGTGSDLLRVAFVDQQHGWAVGTGGTIVATTDGGRNWRPQQSGTTNDLGGLSFVDVAHGWAVGDNATILAYYVKPRNTSTPKVVGRPLPGKALACTRGGWAGGNVTFAFRWRRDGKPIADAVSPRLAVKAGDSGHILSCAVRASNPDGSATAVSDGVKVPQCVVPNVVGKKLWKAKRAIKKAHCAVGKVRKKKSSHKPNRVLSQRPKHGKRLAAGSKVALVVSKR